MCLQTMNILALIRAEKSMMKDFMREKEKWTKTRMMSRRWLILLYTIQLVTPKVIKFQNPRLCSSCEIFDEHFHIHYIGVRDRKGENRKRRQK